MIRRRVARVVLGVALALGGVAVVVGLYLAWWWVYRSPVDTTRFDPQEAGVGSWCSAWLAGMAAVDASAEPFESMLPTAKAGVALGHSVISPAAADAVAAINTDAGDAGAPAPGAALQATYTIEAECIGHQSPTGPAAIPQEARSGR